MASEDNNSNPCRQQLTIKERFKLKMLDAASDTYREATVELDQLSVDLERVMINGASQYDFKVLLQRWMLAFDEVKVAEQQWKELMSTAELDQFEYRFSQQYEFYESIRLKAIEFVDFLAADPSEDEPPDRHNSQLVELQRKKAEINALQKQVDQLQESVSAGSRDMIELRRQLSTQGSSPVHQESPSGPDSLSFVPQVTSEYTASPEQQRSAEQNAVPYSPERERGLPGHLLEFTPPREEFVPTSTTPTHSPSVGTDPVLIKLVELFSVSQRKDRLPRIEPDVFEGDIMQYPLWWSSFETLIDQDLTTPREKLFLLARYTKGEAKESIKGFLSLHNDDTAYDKARALLAHRYGDAMKITNAYRTKVRGWPVIRGGDVKALRKYSDFLWQINAIKNTMGFLESLDTQDENYRLVAKLPEDMRRRWNRTVVDRLYENIHVRGGGANDYGDYPRFEEFCMFVTREARIADGPCAPRLNDQENRQRGDGDRRGRGLSLATGAATTRRQVGKKTQDSSRPTSDRPKPTPWCRYCKGQHYINQCTTFLEQTADFKKSFATEASLCYGCLSSKHSYRDCRYKNESLMKDGTSNNVDKQKEKKDSQSLNTNVNNCDYSLYASMIVPVLVFHHDNPNVKLLVYALLDTQSNSCFLQESLVSRLSVKGRVIELQLTTMGSRCNVESRAVSGLCVQGINESECISLPESYTRSWIPAERNSIPRPEMVQGWDHLVGLESCLMPYQENVKVELLIGYNCSGAFLPREVRAGELGQPYGVRTSLGWTVMGPTGASTQNTAPACYRTDVKEVKMEDVRRAFDTGFDCSDNVQAKWSQEDTWFMDLMKKEIVFLADGRVQLPLPTRESVNNLPSSRNMALKRVLMLRNKLKKNKDFRDKYIEFMQKMITAGHAELVDGSMSGEGPEWFLPHHGVYHPRKPGKLRVVFDGKAEVGGMSLNSVLMSGPDLGNTLIGVLCRFRSEVIAFTCDVEAMFLQVKVPPSQRNLLKFFWFRNNDPKQDIVEYRLTIHLFGATSSPACAMFAFRAVVDRYGDENDKAVGQFIAKDFYVDDGLCSVSSELEAIDMIERSHSLCCKGGFNLTKYLCNSVNVMEKIPVELRAKEVQNINLSESSIPPQMTLGITWDLESDSFRFMVNLLDRPPTRRGMLSALGSIFDPLGLISPLLLPGRRILQNLCKSGHGWDETLTDQVVDEWTTWYNSLKSLSELRIERCMRLGLKGMVTAELDIYCDASSVGYGACAYVTLRDVEGCRRTTLVMAKSKVVPSKPVTIPRLELQAAVLGTQLKDMVIKELHYSFDRINFWSDSKVVLGYIWNKVRKFHIYVANRVQRIHERSSPDQWLYINTDVNPADIASRGLLAPEMIGNTLWWHGPDLRVILAVPQGQVDPVREDDPEVKREVQVLKVAVEPDVVMEGLKRVSDWGRLIRLVALWLRYLENLKCTVKKTEKPPRTARLMVDELEAAQNAVVRNIQRVEFGRFKKLLCGLHSNASEVDARKQKRKLKKLSNVFRLNPVLDSTGIIRVGGRVGRSDLPLAIAHPILLPKKHQLVVSLIRYHHVQVKHSGRGITLNALRANGWWILQGRSAVDAAIRNCVWCKRFRGRPQVQQMADLPPERAEPAPPFTYVGVDFFGPFRVKEGRSVKKRYGCIFTCLTLRAVHLEVCPDLTTDAFINAYRRFVARRGAVRSIKSDRGTNIVGAQGELEMKLDALDDDAIQSEMLRHSCDWVQFDQNPPRAPHMGGVWERMVGTVKKTLGQILAVQGEQLSDDSLQTFMIEVESIVNHRPLTYAEMSDVESDPPLTPAQLLTLKQQVVYPPFGEFVSEDMYSRKRWRRVQYLSNQFWNRWRKEYVPLLQIRSRWTEVKDNTKVGDVVLMIDEQVPRNDWPLGLVVAVTRSGDGLIRSVKVKTSRGEYERPISKVVLLFHSDYNVDASVNL